MRLTTANMVWCKIERIYVHKKSGSHHRHCIELQPESLVAVIDRRAWVHFAASVIRMGKDCDDQDSEQDV